MKSWLKRRCLEDQHFILWIVSFFLACFVVIILRPNLDFYDNSLDATILRFVYVGGGTWVIKKLLNLIFDVKAKDDEYEED